MNQQMGAWLSLAVATLYTLLFHDTPIGLNLLIFEILILGIHWRFYRESFKEFLPKYLGILLLFSSLFTVITHSAFSLAMNYICLIVFIGSVQEPKLRSALTGLGMGVTHFIGAQLAFFGNLKNPDRKKPKVGRWLWQLRLFLLPLLIIIIFMSLYGNSNPIFGDWVNAISEQLGKVFDHILNLIDFPVFWTFLGGFIIANFALLKSRSSWMMEFEMGVSDHVVRKKTKWTRDFNKIALKNELKSAVFLFATLNALLFLLLLVEIDSVWINFEWSGSTLKEFVHEGTYLLILSILISILLVLFYFRGNLNFYSKNVWLKRLSNIWILQNAILVLSVVIRNFWYVHYFALAHLRIGLFMFLLLTWFGLFLVYLKVNKKMSFFYILRMQFLATLTLVTVGSFFDWDRHIAKYNLAHSQQAYFHFDFLVSLSNSTLPILNQPIERLEEIDTYQMEQYSDERNSYSPAEFKSRVDLRAAEFMKKYEERNLLSWNLSDHRTYRALSKMYSSEDNSQP